MDQLNFKDILERYRSGRCTDTEKKLIEDWITHGEFPNVQLDEEDLESELKKISSELPLHKERQLWYKAAAAAAIVTVLFGLSLLYLPTSSNRIEHVLASKQVIAPGKTGATLTLANGKQIRLSEAAIGDLAQESGVSVTKSTTGQLIYKINSTTSVADQKNTLSTINGETYAVQLPDGSLVHLNASSSLTYPVRFASTGKRVVRLTGEGYFEVAKDKLHPFVVYAGEQQVEVLGTHFNINAYEDEPAVKTTLLEGSVKVSGGRTAKKLIPGQQSILRNDNIVLTTADIEATVAWKNGQIILDGQDVPTVMRMVSRWYNVKVEYQGEISKELYYAKISRFDQLDKLLKLLEKAQGVHFKVEGRTVIVTK